MIEVIGIPQGTRLIAVTVGLYDDQTRMWLAVKDMSKPPREWEGTYLRVRRDGSVIRATYDKALTVPYSEMLIKPKR